MREHVQVFSELGRSGLTLGELRNMLAGTLDAPADAVVRVLVRPSLHRDGGTVKQLTIRWAGER